MLKKIIIVICITFLTLTSIAHADDETEQVITLNYGDSIYVEFDQTQTERINTSTTGSVRLTVLDIADDYDVALLRKYAYYIEAPFPKYAMISHFDFNNQDRSYDLVMSNTHTIINDFPASYEYIDMDQTDYIEMQVLNNKSGSLRGSTNNFFYFMDGKRVTVSASARTLTTDLLRSRANEGVSTEEFYIEPLNGGLIAYNSSIFKKKMPPIPTIIATEGTAIPKKMMADGSVILLTALSILGAILAVGLVRRLIQLFL